jgi:hypothetical protein
VGVGTGAPDATFQVNGSFKLVDGNQSNGKVLTSDANGVATWQTASGGGLPAGTSGQTLRHDGTTWVANSILFNNGTNVGVGTASPGAKLDVDGSATFNESGAAVNFRVESDANTHMLFVDGTNNEIGINTSAPSSTFDIQGSLGYKVNTITAATTLNQTHNVVLCNTGPYTVTLPAAASNTGKVYYIKNIDATGDLITIDGNGSETIEGSLNYFLRGFKHSVRIISDGTSWHVLEEVASNGTYHCGEFKDLTWFPVTNPVTGKTWMDRNLGATKVAVSHTDTEAYGDLYQWGRLADGHQCRNSGTTATLSTTNVPGHSNFILTAQHWRDPLDATLWQGVNGVNNPCPQGYRIPTVAEWAAEYGTWSAVSGDAALVSNLKIPVGNTRSPGDGSIGGIFTYLWTTTHNNALRFSYGAGGAGIVGMWSGNGFSVRCIKD